MWIRHHTHASGADVVSTLLLPGGVSAPVTAHLVDAHLVDAHPVDAQQTSLLVAACLSGHVAAASLDLADGGTRLLWTRDLGNGPLFAPPLAAVVQSTTTIMVVDVHGVVTALGLQGGPFWKAAPEGPAWGPCFAPLVLADASVMVVHERGGVRWLDAAQGTTRRAVAGVTGALPTGLVACRGALVGCTSAGVVVVLDEATGAVREAAALDAESFSGVCCVERGVLCVGCRDDYVYCIHW